MASSFKVTRFGIEGNLTGSVQGTASFSINGLTASYAVTASYVYQPTLYFGEDVTADQKAENLRVLADLSTRGLGGMAQSSRVNIVISYFGTPTPSEIQVTACISNSGTYTLQFIFTNSLFAITDGLYVTTSAADGTLTMPSEAEAERIFYTNIDRTLDTGSVVDTWVTQSETRSSYGLPSPMEIIDATPERSWFRYENRLSRGCHNGQEQGVSFYEFLLPGFDNSLTVRVTDSAVYVKWTAAGGVLDAQLNETSSNSIENHAVYDQYMTQEDTNNILESINPDYFINQYLTFEILSSGSITRGDVDRIDTYYNLNDTGWNILNPGDELEVDEGDVVKFAGIHGMGEPEEHSPAPDLRGLPGETCMFDSITCRYNVYGNIVSLLSNEHFSEAMKYDHLLEGGYDGEFYGMFANSPVVNANFLKLPAGYLVPNCYSKMFMNCTELVNPPKLPSTNLAPYCYADMFAGCTSLTTAPELPALELPEGCYYEMFSGSSVLNRVECMGIPDGGSEEPIEKGPILAKGTGDEGPTTNWLAGVAPTGTFVQNPSATWETGSASGIPVGWTVEIADSIYIPVPSRFSSFTTMSIEFDDGGGGERKAGGETRGETKGTTTQSIWLCSMTLPPSARVFASNSIHMEITGSIEDGGDIPRGDTRGTYTYEAGLTFYGYGTVDNTPSFIMDNVTTVMTALSESSATIRGVGTFRGNNHIGNTLIWVARVGNETKMYMVPGISDPTQMSVTNASLELGEWTSNVGGVA